VSSWPDEDKKHRVAPLSWAGDLAQTKSRLRQAVLSTGNATFVDETETYWHVEFLFDREKKLIHVRSASRVGYSDLGVNRKRVEKIRSLFQ